jgi:DNA-directed RNA polymerase specialized sigma subunit
MSKVKVEKVVESKSSMIRRMYFDEGKEVSEISKETGIRYQMVYNIVSESCLKRGIEMRVREKGDSKKDRIVELFKEGRSLKDIARECDTYYNYVSKVVNRHLNESK